MNELEMLKTLIRRFEGCKLKAYYCPAGVLTIGWGSTGAGIYPYTRWTQEQADARLEVDARKFLAATKELFPNVSGGLLVALADFAYNVGIGRLKASTLRKKVLAGNLEAAKKQFMRWVFANGKKMNGLVKRREAEVNLF
jgi:lysozyme